MSEFLIYQSEDGKAMGTISEHNKRIFGDGELTSEVTVRLFRTVQTEGRAPIAFPALKRNMSVIG